MSSSMTNGGTTRRRAAVSCDHCKRRRARCIRPSPPDPCTNCVASDVKCETTVPRKQRVYGSVETLSQRFRALDALVAGLFPDKDIRGPRGLDTLYQLATDRGIEMPEYGDLTPSSDAFAKSMSAKPIDRSPSGRHPVSFVASLPQGNSPTTPGTNASDTWSAVNGDIEEKLIPTAHGAAHYIGPSSSFRLVGAIRGLVAISPFARGSQRADFVDLRASKALERPEAVQDNDQDDPMTDGQISLAWTQTGQSSLTARSAPGSVLQQGQPFSSTLLAPSANLPTRETADLFVGNFFEKIHPNYPLFHRPTFQLSYEAVWEPGATEETRRKTDTGWLCCLYMVLAFGAQLQEQSISSAEIRQEARALQKRYLDVVRSSLSRLIGTTTRANVQALLLLQLYEHNSGQRNASWMFLGCASRMAVALGMHRMSAVSADIDAAERETRRRVWWTLYGYERSLCVMLGRPSAIEDAEMNVHIPDDSVSDIADGPPKYTEYWLRLCRLMGQIKQSKYPAPEAESDDPPQSIVPRRLLRDLDAWWESLPSHLRPEWRTSIPRQRRAVILLHIYYHHIRTIITLPYLLDRIKSDIKQQQWVKTNATKRRDSWVHAKPGVDQVQEAESLTHTCLSSAEKTLAYLQQLAQLGMLDGVGWTDVYYIYHCVLVLCLDLIPQQPGAALSEGQLRRKMAVKAIYAELRHIPLAPTYRILTRVGRQFADIVGALNDEPRSHGELATDIGGIIDGGIAREQRKSVIDQFENYTPWSDENTQELMNDWFLGDFPTMPWDSFDMGAYATPTSMPPYNEDSLMIGGLEINQVARGGGVISRPDLSHGTGTAAWSSGTRRDG